MSFEEDLDFTWQKKQLHKLSLLIIIMTFVLFIILMVCFGEDDLRMRNALIGAITGNFYGLISLMLRSDTLIYTLNFDGIRLIYSVRGLKNRKSILRKMKFVKKKSLIEPINIVCKIPFRSIEDVQDIEEKKIIRVSASHGRYIEINKENMTVDEASALINSLKSLMLS